MSKEIKLPPLPPEVQQAVPHMKVFSAELVARLLTRYATQAVEPYVAENASLKAVISQARYLPEWEHTSSRIRGLLDAAMQKENHDTRTTGREAGEAVAQPTMTAHRAAYFMRRFKNEEKLLGPNEQAALDFVIALLAAPAQQPLGDGQKQQIHDATGAGHALICLVESYIHEAHGIGVNK